MIGKVESVSKEQFSPADDSENSGSKAGRNSSNSRITVDPSGKSLCRKVYYFTLIYFIFNTYVMIFKL